jgi:hypothetical protein
MRSGFAFLLAAATLHRWSAQALSGSTLSFSPAVAGVPTAITFSFTTEDTVDPNTFITVTLAGFTSGLRGNTAGEDIGSASDLVLELSPSATFAAYFIEGTVAAEFADSKIAIKALTPLSPSTSYTIEFDAGNGIVSNCGHPLDYELFTWKVDDVDYSTYSAAAQAMGSTSQISEDCYATSTSISFFPGRPKTSLDITITFAAARTLYLADTIVIALPGFTEGAAGTSAGSSKALPSFEPTESFSAAAWTEGVYVKDAAGYAGSQILLTVASTLVAGALQTVTFSRTDEIKAQCGMPENRDEVTISFTGAGLPSYTPLWSASQAFESSSPIGDGCYTLNFCSGSGECDACLNRCQCGDGFGSDADKSFAATAFALDCSDRACPTGIAIQPVFSSGGVMIDPDEGHILRECSNIGVCNREIGACECPEGFEGGACQRQQCPNACSGHGQCRSMRQLAPNLSAAPLSGATEYTSPASGGTGTWDADTMYACICESSWSVGLGSSETQQAEWFGPDCSLRRCPSGDDPETVIDETDGEGIICDPSSTYSLSGGGASGNLCHVDCSRRGICDHSTGKCTCFSDFTSHNCAQSLSS